jgi:hypothetical protein
MSTIQATSNKPISALTGGALAGGAALAGIAGVGQAFGKLKPGLNGYATLAIFGMAAGTVVGVANAKSPTSGVVATAGVAAAGAGIGALLLKSGAGALAGATLFGAVGLAALAGSSVSTHVLN